jgi:energy-coupling factor transport system substrate-specific component
MEGNMSNKKWSFETRQAVFSGIGAALYGVLGYATSFLRIPGPFNSSIRPAVVLPILFGAFFGPWVGFITGVAGNIIIDLLSGYGFSWNWSLGNGLLGLIAGLAFVRSETELPSLKDTLIWAIVANLVAFLFSSVTDIWVYATEPGMVPTQYVTVIVPNLIAIAVLVPLLYIAYQQIQERSGR